jgi:hypothetical protein
MMVVIVWLVVVVVVSASVRKKLLPRVLFREFRLQIQTFGGRDLDFLV